MQIRALNLESLPYLSNLYLKTHVSGNICVFSGFGTNSNVPFLFKVSNSALAAAINSFIKQCRRTPVQFLGSGGRSSVENAISILSWAAKKVFARAESRSNFSLVNRARVCFLCLFVAVELNSGLKARFEAIRTLLLVRILVVEKSAPISPDLEAIPLLSALSLLPRGVSCLILTFGGLIRLFDGGEAVPGGVGR